MISNIFKRLRTIPAALNEMRDQDRDRLLALPGYAAFKETLGPRLIHESTTFRAMPVRAFGFDGMTIISSVDYDVEGGHEAGALSLVISTADGPGIELRANCDLVFHRVMGFAVLGVDTDLPGPRADQMAFKAGMDQRLAAFCAAYLASPVMEHGGHHPLEIPLRYVSRGVIMPEDVPDPFQAVKADPEPDEEERYAI